MLPDFIAKTLAKHIRPAVSVEGIEHFAQFAQFMDALQLVPRCRSYGKWQDFPPQFDVPSYKFGICGPVLPAPPRSAFYSTPFFPFAQPAGLW